MHAQPMYSNILSVCLSVCLSVTKHETNDKNNKKLNKKFDSKNKNKLYYHNSHSQLTPTLSHNRNVLYEPTANISPKISIIILNKDNICKCN